MADGIYSTEQWLEWGHRFYLDASGHVDYNGTRPGEDKMERVSPEQMESNPIHWLQYYSSWMAYFSAVQYMWEGIATLLEKKYKNLYSKALVDVTGPEYQRVAQARVACANLLEAEQVATMRARKHKTEFEAAEAYRDLVSRSVTARESDRRVTRQW